MKLKINDRYYTTQCYPKFCHGCTFEYLSICIDRFSLLNDLCIQKNIIYIENESIKVLDYENSIPK